MNDTIFGDQLINELNSPLDPARVVTMADGPSAGVPYLAGYDVIQRANELFGYGNWGFELLALPTMHEGTNKSGGGYTVWMAHGRLTVRGGLVFSDMGTNLQSGPGGPATEMASKGAVTDAMKRCLKQYGSQFGLVLYDKSMSRAELEADYQSAHGGPAAEPPVATPPPARQQDTMPAERVQRFSEMKRVAGDQSIGLTHLVRALSGPGDQPAPAQSTWFVQHGAIALEAWLTANPDKGVRDLVDRASDFKRAAQPAGAQ